ncbi:hypothetical protein GCM10027030_22990 [Luteococcus sediminum]
MVFCQRLHHRQDQPRPGLSGSPPLPAPRSTTPLTAGSPTGSTNPTPQHPWAPATIGWLLWHVEWWWTTTLAQVGNQPVTDPTDFLWSGGTDRIVELKAKWDEVLATRSMDEPISWVMPEPQPLGRVAGWLNFELAKNLAEINQTMMLHATL